MQVKNKTNTETALLQYKTRQVKNKTNTETALLQYKTCQLVALSVHRWLSVVHSVELVHSLSGKVQSTVQYILGVVTMVFSFGCTTLFTQN